MADVNISKFRAQVVREGSKPATPGFVVSEGQNPVDPAGSGQNHLPVTIGTPANGLAVTEDQVLTIDKAQIFAGTSSQFVKGDGTLDSTAYGTGSVTSVALTMPAAFSVANSPVTTAGTLAVTATGTTSQYIRGDGSLETFPALTGFVPYTGATADVNLGTFDLLAERGTFANNGSSYTLTVNHTSGSGYGIIVTKGGNNEALYVSKTSGSGNAMTVVGGRTSLVDLALSSVSNTAGDFLTLSGGVVHKRTAAEVRTDIGAGTVTSVGLSSATSGVTIGSTPVTTSGTITLAIATASGSQNGLLSSTDWTTFNNKQNALTNPVTGTGTTNYLPKFTGSTTIGDSVIADNATEINITKRIFLNSGGQSIFFTPNLSSASNRIEGSSGVPLEIFTSGSELRFAAGGVSTQITLLSSGNVGIGTASPSQKLEVNNGASSSYVLVVGQSRNLYLGQDSIGAAIYSDGSAPMYFATNATERMRITSGGNLLVGTTTDAGFKLDVNGTGRFSASSAALSISNASDLWYNITRGSSFTNIGVDSTGSFYNTNTSHRFLTNSGSTTALTITSGGELLVSGSYNPFPASGRANITLNGTSSNLIAFTNNSSPLGYIFHDSTDLEIVNTAGMIRLYTANTERMRITSGGNVLIGTTTDNGFRLDVNGTGRFNGNTTGAIATFINTNTAGTGNGLLVDVNSQLGTDNYVMNLITNGTSRMYVREDGLVFMSGLISSFTTGNAANMFVSSGDGAIYRSTSSIKYKKNVKNYEKGLKEVLNLRPVTYEGLGLIDSNKTFAGLIAEEVHELGLNEFVQYAEDGTPDALGYQNMIALLTKAIQELKQEIDTLKN